MVPLVTPIIVGSAGSTIFGIVLASACVVSFACTLSLKDSSSRSLDF
ncbi:hypothetical protein K7711_19570 [Nocardia sp. CA2R105]|nr:hypothetical protein [Nocardia coffeae]MBY8858686.1 hypothetical protein [Nocardia coffeae]